MFKMFWYEIEQVTILYPIQYNAMVLIVKGKHEVLTYSVVLKPWLLNWNLLFDSSYSFRWWRTVQTRKLVKITLWPRFPLLVGGVGKRP